MVSHFAVKPFLLKFKQTHGTVKKSAIENKLWCQQSNENYSLLTWSNCEMTAVTISRRLCAKTYSNCGDNQT